MPAATGSYSVSYYPGFCQWDCRFFYDYWSGVPAPTAVRLCPSLGLLMALKLYAYYGYGYLPSRDIYTFFWISLRTPPSQLKIFPRGLQPVPIRRDLRTPAVSSADKVFRNVIQFLSYQDKKKANFFFPGICNFGLFSRSLSWLFGILVLLGDRARQRQTSWLMILSTRTLYRTMVL